MVAPCWTPTGKWIGGHFGGRCWMWETVCLSYGKQALEDVQPCWTGEVRLKSLQPSGCDLNRLWRLSSFSFLPPEHENLKSLNPMGCFIISPSFVVHVLAPGWLPCLGGCISMKHACHPQNMADELWLSHHYWHLLKSGRYNLLWFSWY